MKLHDIRPIQKNKARKRIGRGTGSGWGNTSGKGRNGQNARSGGGVRLGFEGGQTPLFKRLPKRGFTNFTKTDYAIVNVSDLNVFDAGSVVTLDVLLAKKIVRKGLDGLKILGDGELTTSLTIKANKVSASAKAKIEAAGGQVEVI
jgi:large subunit ribosomal protein L15